MLRKVKPSLFIYLGLLSWMAYLAHFFLRSISLRKEGLFVGHEHLWSDWALHLGMAQIFATKPPHLWFAYHPIFADGKLTYAFLTNLISGLMMRVGFSIPTSFIFPSIVLSILLVLGLFKFFERLLRSKAQALLALSLLFLSGGLGFLKFDFKLDHLLNPPVEYSRLESYGWYSSNLLVGFLLPQRAFLLGMVMTLWSVLGLLTQKHKLTLVLCGLLFGLLPIAHMHSLMIWAIILAPYFLFHRKDWKRWIYFCLPAFSLASILYLIFISGGIKSNHFIFLKPGFVAKDILDWLFFWLQAWGFILIFASLGFLKFLKDKDKEAVWFFSGFFLVFLLANLIQFQPIQWDNSKFFMWSYVGFCALSVKAFSEGWTRHKGIVLLSILSLTLTGALELIRLSRVDSHTHQLLTQKEIEIAKVIRDKTDPLARFVTNTDHKHLVMALGARPILLGYTAWALNFGFDYDPIEKDIALIYKGGEQAKDLLKVHYISYVFVGPSEMYKYHPNLEYFNQNFPKFYDSEGTRIFDVRLKK